MSEVGVMRVPVEEQTAPLHLKVAVYVCPTPGCGNYYGASTMGDLGKQFTGPKVEDRAGLARATGSEMRHTRAECPDCRQRGLAVERKLVERTIQVEASGPPTPPLPDAGDINY